MKALILAAGEGTRLRPLTLDRPKPMLPIGVKPLLEHLVTWLHSHHVRQIAINLHHQPEAITDYFGDGSRFGVTLTYSYEEQLLGTAGAVRRLTPFFDEQFVVVYGDVFTNIDLTALCQFHCASASRAKSNTALTLALYHVPNPSQCGLVELDKGGRIMRYVEKPPPDQVFTDLANAGIMVVDRGVLHFIPDEKVCDFGHDVFPRLLSANVPMFGQPIGADEFVIDIGTPAGYARAQEQFRDKEHNSR